MQAKAGTETQSSKDSQSETQSSKDNEKDKEKEKEKVMARGEERYEYNMRTNPMEICSVVHKNQTFAVQSALSEAGKGGDVNQPLKIYSAFSRFPVCIIQDHTSVSAKLKVSEIPGLAAKTEACVRKEMDRKDVPSEQKSPAFTRSLSAGRGLKGKTPAQVLAEAEDKNMAMEMLNRQYKWLKDSVERDSNSKFAASNKAQMEAIEDASKLFREGRLEASRGTSGSCTLTATTPHPVMSRTREDGKNFVYEYSVSWVFGNRSPVSFEISNYYSQVIRRENGMLNTTGNRENEIRFSVSLNEEEWLYVLYAIQTNMRLFENGYAAEAFRTANRQAVQNRERVRKA